MSRHARTIPKLDQAHAALREHPGSTAEELAQHLPKVECWCPAGASKYTWGQRGPCWACADTGQRAPERQVAYGYLVKLEQDGRARRDKPQYGGPHLWYAVVDAETEALEAWFEELGDQAPDDPAEEWRRLEKERTEALAEAAIVQAAADELVRQMYEQMGTYKAVAAALGVHANIVAASMRRRWRRTLDAEDAEDVG